MSGPTPELADIFRQHGPAYRKAHPLPLYQHRLMQAIETCRTEVLGGSVEGCDHCQYTHTVYRSCRNRHCPKCQGLAREKWLQQRQAEWLPTEYFHVVFTLPEPIAAIAFYNKELVYDMLFGATAETLLTLARDPQRLGVEIGFFAVLHSWGQNLHFHPHLHCVVPGGGLSADHDRWISGRPGFLLPVKILSHLFRRLLLEALEKAYAAGQLQFFGDLEPLRDSPAFVRYLAPLKNAQWVVYAKSPFGGPQQVLQYLGRYTHRVAISNRRLLALEQGQVSFQWKDYRDQQQQKVLTVSAEEFIRRFLQHALPPGFQRIRYYGFLANCHRAEKLELCRRLLATPCSALLPQPADCRDYLVALTTNNLRLCPPVRHRNPHTDATVTLPRSGSSPRGHFMRLSPAETRNDAGSAFPAGHTPGLFTPSLRHSDTPGFAPFLSNITEVSAAWPRFAFRHVPCSRPTNPTHAHSSSATLISAAEQNPLKSRTRFPV